jgi:hypothetical protein
MISKWGKYPPQFAAHEQEANAQIAGQIRLASYNLERATGLEPALEGVRLVRRMYKH